MKKKSKEKACEKVCSVDNQTTAKEFDRGQMRFFHDGKVVLVSFTRPEVIKRMAEYILVYRKIRYNCGELTPTEINTVAKQLCFKD